MPTELFRQLPDIVSMTEMNLKFLCKLAWQYILGGRGLNLELFSHLHLELVTLSSRAWLSLGEPVALERSILGPAALHVSSREMRLAVPRPHAPDAGLPGKYGAPSVRISSELL